MFESWGVQIVKAALPGDLQSHVEIIIVIFLVVIIIFANEYIGILIF